MEEDEHLQPPCSFCSVRLTEPYVECIECTRVSLCTECFSRGAEPSGHRNDHGYSIRTNDGPLFERTSWSANEEFLLLQAVSRFGYGNWDDVAKVMQKYTRLQCKEHYDHFYIDKVQHHELPKFTAESTVRSDPPYLLRNTDEDDPPRDSKSAVSRSLGGYNAYRSDFEVDYDDHAEQTLDFEEIEDDDEDAELTRSLQCAVVNTYNNRLRERLRRYDVVRRHGLISHRKFSTWLRPYEEALGKSTCDRLCAFMPILSGVQFDALMESLSRESELRLRLYKLYELRRNGVTTEGGHRAYEESKKRRESDSKELKLMTLKYCEWKQISESTPSSVMSVGDDMQSRSVRKRLVPPLDIIGLTGYEKLTEKERGFCSTVRIPPASFIEFRETLINESGKRGFLRLCDARKLIKIDVNKTRKLYDMLVSEGLVKSS